MKAPHHAQHHHAHTTHAVGKAAKPATPGGGGTSATGGKGTATGKHHRHNHRKHEPKKARKWTPDGDVALCSARALAESLRLAGGAVSDEDALALYWRTASDADAGASILATLEAAYRFGLAGARPCFSLLDALTCSNGKAFTHYRRSEGWPTGLLLDREVMPHEPEWLLATSDCRSGLDASRAGLILGIDLPGLETHAVLDDGSRWWSWGQPYNPADFPGAVVEEAWAVTW